MAKSELLPGTLDMLILKVLSQESLHGWGVSERIQQLSGDVFEANQGSLYPALQRLKRKGFVTAEGQRTEANRRARYYEITAPGRTALAEERATWRRSSEAVNQILEWAVPGTA